MTFSTRSNPRIGQGVPAITSLGAVGGPRGVGAGALRILVEFVSTYNKEAAQQLEGDLARVDQAQQVANSAQTKRLRELATVRNRIDTADALIRGKLNTAQRSQLKTLESLNVLRTTSGKEQAATLKKVLDATLVASGLGKDEIKTIHDRIALKKQEAVLVERQSQAEERSTARQKNQIQIQNQLSKIEAGRASVGSKLAGLGIGAVGGLVGGALIGVGFQAAQAVLDALGEKFQDIIDPARHARDAIDSVGAAINKLADADKSTLLQASTKFLQGIGIRDDATASILARVAAEQALIEKLKERKEIQDILAHSDADQKELHDRTRDLILAKAESEGATIKVLRASRDGLTPQRTLINGIELETLVTNDLNASLREEADAARLAARGQAFLADQTAFAAIQQRNLQDAISSSIQGKIDNLGSGESARAKSLQARIDALSSGGGGSGLKTQLQNIEEERQLILLRQRLKLLGTNINLEKYAGKFLLEAINAKIAALQKEGDEQDRLNHLLDLQFTESQRIKRQQGESIQEFQERRAQEQRHQLEERAKLEREAVIASLEDQKSKVEDEVALAALAEQKKEALRQAGTASALKELQKQLAAQRAADAKALKDKQAALQELQRQVAYYSSLATNEQIRQAIRAAQSVDAIATVSGESRGLKAAKQFLQVLLDSGVLSAAAKASVKDSINQIDATLSALYDKEERLYRNVLSGPGGRTAFSKGGVFPITNAQNPFGQNVRTGEEGTELGVVLSNKVVHALKGYGSSGAQFGDFNFYGQYDDPYRTRYEMKEMIKEVVREELHV